MEDETNDYLNQLSDVGKYSMGIPKSMMGNDDILDTYGTYSMPDDFDELVKEFSKYYNSTTLVEKSKPKPLGMLDIKNTEKISIIDTHLKISKYPNEYHIRYTSPPLFDPLTFEPMTKSGVVILSRIPANDGYWILGDKTDGSIYKQKMKMDSIKDIHKFIGKIWGFIYNLYK
jgi:hypothetical protein